MTFLPQQCRRCKVLFDGNCEGFKFHIEGCVDRNDIFVIGQFGDIGFSFTHEYIDDEVIQHTMTKIVEKAKILVTRATQQQLSAAREDGTYVPN